MREMELRYLTDEVAQKIDNIITKAASGEGGVTPDNIIDQLAELLPIQKLQQDTVRRRVEGFYLATELLWIKAIEMSNLSRPELVKLAKLKPLSHYHYLTGSREPKNVVLTRDDYLNDPATALVKLRDDIVAMVEIFPELRKLTKG